MASSVKMNTTVNKEVSLDSATNEVSVDTAINSTPADTSWLDNVICSTITASQEADTDIPLEILGIRLLVEDRDFVEREASVSVVECFKYLFVNIEKIQQDVEHVSLERVSAILSSSRDLAASHLRLADKVAVDMKCLTEMVKTSSDTEDYAVAFQAQCDVSYALAVRGSAQEFKSSILKEVELLLQLRNIEEAYLKIIKFKLYTEGLEVFSSYIRRVELDQFDKIFAIRKKVFEKFLDFMDDDGGGLEHEIRNDRDSATIIVDVNGEKGFKEGKFHVQDLSSALKLAQNGGIIFLENGDYTSDTFFDVKQKSLDPQKLITIIGATTNECSIHGTIKIQAEQRVTFKRIKFEIGDSAESNDAIYILKGHAVFSCCLLEATVNTLWYLIGQESSSTELTVQHCVVDGLESCQRAVTFQGQNVTLKLVQSLFRDMFSVVTVLEREGGLGGQIKNISLMMDGCGVEDVQTGLHLALSTNVAICHMTCCYVTLVLYDQDGDMGAVEVSGGQAVTADNNNIDFKHIDGKGFSVKDVNDVSLDRNCVKSTNEVDRKLAIGEAVVAENVENLVLEKIHLSGFRIGVKIKQALTVLIRNSLIERCSVGISVLKSRQQKKLSVVDSIFQTMYYGVMGEDPRTVLTLQGSQFIDIPKALILCQEMVARLKEEKCAFLLSREYTTSCQADTLEAEMNLYLATSENLPHRVAYEREDIQLVFRFGELGFRE
eukprot:GFUD01000304.1.p1 GENE.GFUD01000304.1~~GFUD01000304.1.p1  ORF type:complete len:719 (+),score=214.29 GFUD01000304.1:251-2407(+)